MIVFQTWLIFLLKALTSCITSNSIFRVVFIMEVGAKDLHIH